ncbi:multidrug ABC transporter [Variovorax sp. JS1663]|nr:multidrug ABC transporter [Variovorax sp. JS1663]
MVLAAMVLVVLDAGIANVALPTIARALQVTPGMAVWVITAYQTALVIGLLPCAALGESLGYRRVFTLGVAVFTAASVLCALSPSLSWLVAARFLQGLGGAAVMSLGMALLRSIIPQQLGAAIGWNALAVALASAAGPTVGALILAFSSWPWLFALSLPLGCAVLFASLALPHHKGAPRRLDLLSMALNGGAFASLVIGAELLVAKPALAVVLLATTALSLAALVRREMPKSTPLVPLDLLRARPFRISVIASICCFAGTTAGLMALPFYLQHSLGQSTLMTGLFMTPWPLMVAIAAPLTGRLAERVSTAWLCAAGGACLSIGLAAASLWPLDGRPGALVPIMMLCGLGFGLFQVPNNRNMFLSAPRERSGAAGGMQGTARLAGQTSGGVIMSLIFTLASVDAAPKIGLAIGAALTLGAGLVSMVRARPLEQPSKALPRKRCALLTVKATVRPHVDRSQSLSPRGFGRLVDDGVGVSKKRCTVL